MAELVEVIKLSKIPILRIKMGKEVFKINIRKELHVNTRDLNYEILTHPKIKIINPLLSPHEKTPRSNFLIQ